MQLQPCRPLRGHGLELRLVARKITTVDLMLGSLGDNFKEAVVQRWRRMVARLHDRRLWHFHGILLWLLQRPGLRFLPCPYPTVKSCKGWALQVESMSSQKIWPARHLKLALKAMTPARLSECLFFRDRIGFELAFLEDQVMGNILLVRNMRGQKAAIHKEAMLEAQREARQVAQSDQRDETIRSLIGPRGGLPTLKGDLVKLATLLHQTVEEKDTVEILKQKVRGPLAAVMATLKNKDSRSRASQDADSMKSLPSSSQSAPPSPDRRAHQQDDLQALEGRVLQSLEKQEKKFQEFFQQMMLHMQSMPKETAATPNSWTMATPPRRHRGEDVVMNQQEQMEEMSRAEVQRLNAEYYQDRRAEWVASHGAEYAPRNPMEWGDLL